MVVCDLASAFSSCPFVVGRLWLVEIPVATALLLQKTKEHAVCARISSNARGISSNDRDGRIGIKRGGTDESEGDGD